MMTTRSGIADRKRLQQDGMNDAEHGGIRSDSERNGEDGDGGETGIFRESAEGVAHREKYIERGSGAILRRVRRLHN